MRKRDGDESRKNLLHDNEVKSPIIDSMDNLQQNPEQGDAKRLSQMRVGIQAIGISKR